MIIRLREELEKIIQEGTRRSSSYPDDNSFKDAINGIINTYKNRSLHAIQGPPGTGKTEVALRAFEGDP
jgi:DNA helicase IV